MHQVAPDIALPALDQKVPTLGISNTLAAVGSEMVSFDELVQNYSMRTYYSLFAIRSVVVTRICGSILMKY